MAQCISNTGNTEIPKRWLLADRRGHAMAADMKKLSVLPRNIRNIAGKGGSMESVVRYINHKEYDNEIQ